MPDGGTYRLANGRRRTGRRHLRASAAREYKGVPEAWMAYIAVDDVDARVKKATKAGAKVMKPAFDVPGVGRIVMLRNPAAPASAG